MQVLRTLYREVWLLDFEYAVSAGERPHPLCLVGREYFSGRYVRLWLSPHAPPSPPFPVDAQTLIVSYYSGAEVSCFLALHWPMPLRVLDLCAEFRAITSGLEVPHGRKLFGAMTWFGFDALSVEEKTRMQALAMRGGLYTDQERRALIEYCQTDVDALAQLLPVMLPQINLIPALFRGRYMVALARVEWTGIPIDTDTLHRLRTHWDAIRSQLVATLDPPFQCYLPYKTEPIREETPWGKTLLTLAAHWQIDPYQLQDTYKYLYHETREQYAEYSAAVLQARTVTGLTPAKMARWENTGRDYSSWARLDDLAQELAQELPALGLGGRHGGRDESDYAGGLWSILRDNPRGPQRHDLHLLIQAAELTAAFPDPSWRYTNGPVSFSEHCFALYLARERIPWPRLSNGDLDLKDTTFKKRVQAFPQLGPLRELRRAWSQLKLQDLAVGADQRNRTVLWAFASKTGRNQPSSSQYIFGPAAWIRSLIRPAPGRALAYIDWSGQELGIAAFLSGDQVMLDTYTSGDFYLRFAHMCGAAPANATKASHGPTRELYKVAALAVLFGQREYGLAQRLNIPLHHAQFILDTHRRRFRRFWEWLESIETEGLLTRELRTVLGWPLHTGARVTIRTLQNFLMQGNGADMLRWATCRAVESGIPLCGLVHDVLIVEATIDAIDDTVQRTQHVMAEASQVILPGFALRSDATIVRYPDHYEDSRGTHMRDIVLTLLADIERTTQGIQDRNFTPTGGTT